MNKSFIKYLLFYLAWRILLWAFLNYIFPEIWLLWFIQNYRGYLSILSFSYFLYCHYKDEPERKFEYLRNTLIIGNTYLTLHIFFRPLLNIPWELFILLGIILIIIRYIKNLHIKWKKIFYTIWGILSFLIIISWLFYLYPEAPDVQGFINRQQTQLILHSPIEVKRQQAYIQIIDIETSRIQEKLFNQGTSLFNTSTNFQINYISTTTDNEFETFLIFPDWSLLQILPQHSIISNIILEYNPQYIKAFSAPRQNMNKIYLPENKNIITIEEETYRKISTFYRNNFQQHLTQQIGSQLRTNSSIQNINISVLSFLSKIFPWFFSQNVKNAQQFQYYFTFFNNQERTIETNKYNISKEIKDETNIFQQIKNNIKISFQYIKSF